MAIAIGSRLPEATFKVVTPSGPGTKTTGEVFSGKRVVLFAVPGAFTPTCSQKHLPGFVEKAAELRAKGVDTLACVSVNDAFVMKAWKKDQKIGDEVLLLSDGNLEFTKAVFLDAGGEHRGDPPSVQMRKLCRILSEKGVGA